MVTYDGNIQYDYAPGTVNVVLPDLVITNIYDINTDYYPGEDISVVFDVTNQGNGDASATEVGLYFSSSQNTVNGEPSGSCVIDPISSGLTGFYTIQSVIPEGFDEGTVWANLFVDFSQNVNEENEDNNVNSISFNYLESDPPEITFYEPEITSEAYENEDITFNIQGNDPNGDIAQIIWYVDDFWMEDNDISGFSFDENYNTFFPVAGDHEVYAIIYDYNGNTDEITWTITIYPDVDIIVTEPAIDIIVYQEDIVNISWSGTGPSNSIVSLFVDEDDSWMNGNETNISLIQPISGSYSWDTSDTIPGVYFIAAYISQGGNNDHDYASGTVTITGNNPPVITAYNPETPLTVNTYDIITFEVLGDDPNSDLNQIRWWIDSELIETHTISGSSFNDSFSHVGFLDGQNEVRAVVSDDNGNFNEILWNVNVSVDPNTTIYDGHIVIVNEQPIQMEYLISSDMTDDVYEINIEVLGEWGVSYQGACVELQPDMDKYFNGMYGYVYFRFEDVAAKSNGDFSIIGEGEDINGNFIEDIEFNPPVDNSQLIEAMTNNIVFNFLCDLAPSVLPLNSAIYALNQAVSGTNMDQFIVHPTDGFIDSYDDNFFDEDRYDIIRVPICFFESNNLKKISIQLPIEFDWDGLLDAYFLFKPRIIEDLTVLNSFDHKFEEVIDLNYLVPDNLSNYTFNSVSGSNNNQVLIYQDHYYAHFYMPPQSPPMYIGRDISLYGPEEPIINTNNRYSFKISNIDSGDFDCMSGNLYVLYDDENLCITNENYYGIDSDNQVIELSESNNTTNILGPIAADLIGILYGAISGGPGLFLGTIYYIWEQLNENWFGIPTDIYARGSDPDNPGLPEDFFNYSDYDILKIPLTFQDNEFDVRFIDELVVDLDIGVKGNGKLWFYPVFAPYHFDDENISGGGGFYGYDADNPYDEPGKLPENGQYENILDQHVFDLNIDLQNPNIIPETPNPILPLDDDIVETLEPTFFWDNFQDGGDGEICAGYQLRVRCDDNNDDVVYDTGLISTSPFNQHTYDSTIYYLVSNPLEWNKHYHWHVRYQDSGGEWSAWSADDLDSHQDFYTPIEPTLNADREFIPITYAEGNDSFVISNSGSGIMNWNVTCIPAYCNDGGLTPIA